MAANLCAFRDKIRSPDDYLNLDATDIHMVPYVTGGLGKLMQLIQEDRVPQLHDYGYHTDENGHFTPKDSCTMVLRYKMKKILDSKGQSAVIVLAEDTFRDNSLVVIKVLHTEFYRLGVQESHVLWRLAMTDPLNHSHTLRILTTFTFDSHYCLVFEPLLPDPLTTIFQEFPSHKVMVNIRKVGLRLLATLGFLHQQNLIHTDLKPENILLKYENDLDSVHVVDFGNTINYIHSEVSLYYKDFALQTPLYRAPEVMFGVPFGPEIDIWSLGCIFAELYLGKPLLYGETTEDILKQMYELLGPFPVKLFRRGKFYKNFKQFTTSVDQENKENMVDNEETASSSKIFEHLQYVDYLFADLLSGMLKYDPDERLTASEAAQHPFFASHFPVAFLLPSNSGAKSQLSVPLTKKAYPYTPNIAASIRKGQPSSLDLLRIGTSDVHPLNDLDETTILKPSPRYKMKGQNLSILDEPTRLFPSEFETSGAMTPKTHSQHAKPVQSDISVVKNVISERKDKFSDNVKEKMSSLLKAIRQEQVLVENNLEQRLVNEIQSPKGNRGGYCYRPTESVRPVPKYGAYKENALNRSRGVESFKEPHLMISPNLEKKAGSYSKDTFIIPDKNLPLHRTHRSTEKHKKSDCNMEESNRDKRQVDEIFSCQSNAKRTNPLKNEVVDKMKSPKSSASSSHIFKHTCSPKIEAMVPKSLASEKDVKAPLSPGYTPSRTMSRTKWIHQDSENTTKSYFDLKLGGKMSGGKPISTLDRGQLYDRKSDAKFTDRHIKTENIKGVCLDFDEAYKTKQRLSKSYSPESRKRSHDMSDDDMINILSPVAHGGSSCKRQKYMVESSGKIHDRVHPLEKTEYKEMELDVDDTRSQSDVSPKHISYSRDDKGIHTVANESVHSYGSNQHICSDDGSGPTRENLIWRRVTNNSSDSKGITISENVGKSKSKKRLSQGLPTPIEKQPHVFHNLSDQAATDSPEIVYKKISYHKVNRNKFVRDRLSLESDEFHNYNKGTKPHFGGMNNLTGHNSKLSKYQVRDFEGKTTNRKHGHKCADYSDELNDYNKSSSRTGNVEIDKQPDKFSFHGTPASDRKLEGWFAERIAQRQRKLKKKARKSLNFQGEEEEVSDESYDNENDSDNDSVDLSCGYGLSDNHTAREYHQLQQIPMKHGRKNDQNLVENLLRSGQVINKDRSRTRNTTNKDTRYLNRDATFVLDFESPLRPSHTK